MDATDLHERTPSSPPSIIRPSPMPRPAPAPAPPLFELPTNPEHTPGPGLSTSTLYLPITSPPTPAPSPRPSRIIAPSTPICSFPSTSPATATPTTASPASPAAALASLPHAARLPALTHLLAALSPSELRFLSARIAPLLTRDFLGDLPPELALHVLGFVHEPRTLGRLARVCRAWGVLVGGDGVWRGMCARWGLEGPSASVREALVQGGGSGGGAGMREGGGKAKGKAEADVNSNAGAVEDGDDLDGDEPLEALEHLAAYPLDPALQWLARRARTSSTSTSSSKSSTKSASRRGNEGGRDFSWRAHFAREYKILMNWRTGGALLRNHRFPAPPSTLPNLNPNPNLPHAHAHAHAPEPDPVPNPYHEAEIATSHTMSAQWILVGTSAARVHVFSARTGVLARTLVGHAMGVWCVGLVDVEWEDERERERGDVDVDADSPPSPPVNGEAGSSGATDPEGGGGEKGTKKAPRKTKKRTRTLAVSGACDKAVRVWDVRTGHCLHVLRGHNATVRCLAALPEVPVSPGPRPLRSSAGAGTAHIVSGARDGTLRLWDVRTGACVGVMRGHTESVRAVDVAVTPPAPALDDCELGQGQSGSGRVVVVSGSYDTTVRVWDVCARPVGGEGGDGAGEGYGEGDREGGFGRCRWVLRGHTQQVYVVACDGVRVASGGLDATVRVWGVDSGECLAVLTGHTSLITTLALFPSAPPSHSDSASATMSTSASSPLLASGAADGRILAHSLATYAPMYRLAAHSASVSGLSIHPGGRFLVSGGNDGHTRLFDARSGDYIRDLTEQMGEGGGVRVGVEKEDTDDVQTLFVVDCARANTLVNLRIRPLSSNNSICSFLGGQATVEHQPQREHKAPTSTQTTRLPQRELRLHLPFHLPQPDDQVADTLTPPPILYALLQIRSPAVSPSHRTFRSLEGHMRNLERTFAKDGIGYPVMIDALSLDGGEGAECESSAPKKASGRRSNGVWARARRARRRRCLDRVEARRGPDCDNGAGDVVHLWERECSVQRRFQNVVEVGALFLSFAKST
ncbi:WD40 repeat-like protein [Athelia psychrophila]|uniref:WD40 repeat-like protein n=1 Tax=Athelia psychrophila TaxID=1759441 RepID=A0A166ICK4_9AGAM|nr:WD40 repeat-like protein [Fibularhizoctonia sp. CBS 109695]